MSLFAFGFFKASAQEMADQCNEDFEKAATMAKEAADAKAAASKTPGKKYSMNADAIRKRHERGTKKKTKKVLEPSTPEISPPEEFEAESASSLQIPG